MEVSEQMLNAVSTDLAEINISSADVEQVARFEQAMESNPSMAGMGDDILRSISDFKHRYQEVKLDLQTKITQPEMTVNQLIETQYALLKTTMIIELTAKMAGRLTQNVETLMKTQ